MRRHSQRPTLRNLNPVFHKREKSEDNTVLSEKLLKLARKTGALNLSGRGLATGKYICTCIHTNKFVFYIKTIMCVVTEAIGRLTLSHKELTK